MNFNNLNLSRNWFWKVAEEMSNDAKDQVRNLNSYPNIGEYSMQVALACTHDCYTVLDEIIEVCADIKIEEKDFCSKLEIPRNQMVVDFCKLKPFVNENSQSAIDITKALIQDSLDKIELLLKYVNLEIDGRLTKDCNGNLKEISRLNKFGRQLKENLILKSLFWLLLASILGVFVYYFSGDEDSVKQTVLDFIKIVK